MSWSSCMIKVFRESWFFFLIIEVIDSPFGLELKLLDISLTPYCANTRQIPVKTHFSVTFSSRVSSDRLRYDKKC